MNVNKYKDVKNNITYEYLTENVLPGLKRESLSLKEAFDYCIKKSFLEGNPYISGYSLDVLEDTEENFGFKIGKKNEKTKKIEFRWYDHYFSKQKNLKVLLSNGIRDCFDPPKGNTKKTSGNEFKWKFYSVGSSSRFAVSSFSEKNEDGLLDYVKQIKINEEIMPIKFIDFEHDTVISSDFYRSPELDVFFKTDKGTYFVEVKNHEILDSHKSVQLSWSYFDKIKFFKLLGLGNQKIQKNKSGKIVIDSKFPTAKDFGCSWTGNHSHFEFKQFLCHLMGILNYAEKNPSEEIFFYYLFYKNELFIKEYGTKLYDELEEEIKEVFRVYGERFPNIHFGFCYNNRYDTLTELKNEL